MNAVETALSIISRISGKDRSELNPQLELVADLGLDSSKALELLVKLEDALDVEIEEDDAAELNTVGDIINYVRDIGSTDR